MKKIAGWLSFILLVSLFTGCGRQETDDPAYHIYYLNKEKTKVVEQPYDLKEGKTEDMIATLLDALCTNTDSVEYQKKALLRIRENRLIPFRQQHYIYIMQMLMETDW